jgi:hypothetical protein
MVTMRSGKPSSIRGPVRAVALGAFASLLVMLSCGGESVQMVGDGGEAGEGASSAGGAATTGGTSFGGTAGVARGGRGGTSSGGSSGELPDPNPGCPDAAAPPGFRECDVFAMPTDCPFGEGCYPTIEHPFGMGCDQQVHGSRCAPGGTGEQGDFCPGGTLDCAPGFICIVGGQAGSRCMRMCAIDGSMPCPTGLFCGETDAHGVGVCA